MEDNSMKTYRVTLKNGIIMLITTADPIHLAEQLQAELLTPSAVTRIETATDRRTGVSR